MKFFLIIIVTVLFVIGCGGSQQDDNPYSDIISEPYFYQQWYLEKNDTFYEENNIESDAHIHTGDALLHYRGKGVKIAVIDADVDTEHEDLENAINTIYEIDTDEDNDTMSTLAAYHGTAVTGIIAARRNAKGILGIADESEIVFLKLHEDMSDSGTIELFRKAASLGADIINCSWGTYDVSDSVKETIQDLAKNGREGKGIIIVFASGNGNMDMGNDESAIPEVISVGATDEHNLRAWYSNYGDTLDIVAPGGGEYGITTLDISGEDGVAEIDQDYILYDDYKPFNGTSASAPIVSGSIALLLEKNPNLSREEIDTILHLSSDKIGNIEYEEGRNDYYGYGKINLAKILYY